MKEYDILGSQNILRPLLHIFREAKTPKSQDLPGTPFDLRRSTCDPTMSMKTNSWSCSAVWLRGRWIVNIIWSPNSGTNIRAPRIPRLIADKSNCVRSVEILFAVPHQCIPLTVNMNV